MKPRGLSIGVGSETDATVPESLRSSLRPFGSLWYGGSATASKYCYAGSEHGTNPSSAEGIDGRLILQGNGLLSAFDMYTDRPPRQRSRATGLNYVSASDAIYVAAGPNLIRFDPVDGRRTAEWKVPLDDKPLDDRAKPLCWGAVRIMDNILVATVFSPQDLVDADAGADGNGGEGAGDRMLMAHLVAIDRSTGKLLWSRKADWGFLNRGGVALGGGKVFCIDMLLEDAFAKLKEAGQGCRLRRRPRHAHRALSQQDPVERQRMAELEKIEWPRRTQGQHAVLPGERRHAPLGASTTIPTTIPRSSSATCSLRVMDGRSIWQRASEPNARRR